MRSQDVDTEMPTLEKGHTRCIFDNVEARLCASPCIVVDVNDLTGMDAWGIKRQGCRLVTHIRRPRRRSHIHDDQASPAATQHTLTPGLPPPKPFKMAGFGPHNPPGAPRCSPAAQWLAMLTFVAAIHMDPALVKWNRTIPLDRYR